MNTPLIARVKQDFTCRTKYHLICRGWIIKVLAFEETVDYDDFGNGDILVLGHDTKMNFELDGVTYFASFRGQLVDILDILPDTPATRVLFERGKNESI